MSENTVIELEMGLPAKEFGSVLPNASIPYIVEPTDTGYALQNDQQQRIIIDRTVLSPRAIGSARIPRMKVVITFEGHDEAEVKEYMKRFSRYMHRGGG